VGNAEDTFDSLMEEVEWKDPFSDINDEDTDVNQFILKINYNQQRIRKVLLKYTLSLKKIKVLNFRFNDLLFADSSINASIEARNAEYCKQVMEFIPIKKGLVSTKPSLED
jgi:hypothetical protein